MAPRQAVPLAPAAAPRHAWQRLLPVLLLVAAAWFGVHWLARNEHRPQVVAGAAPLLTLTTFDGGEIDLARTIHEEGRRQPVVVNFWASWCEPCRVEAELFEAAWRAEQARGDDGILFVGVNRQDRRAAALAFLDEFEVSYPNGADDDSAWSRGFGVIGLPTTFFIDGAGEIQAVVWGPITSAAELTQQLEKIRPQAQE
jgi:cytochrome c biogenesis protein CcmG, thiol:disulfide interchange protein DsbE